MTREQYIQNIFETYQLISVLSDKNECKVLRIRHKRLKRDIVLHSLPTAVKTYDVLCGIKSENLPEIYDVINLDDGQIVLEEFIDGITVAQVMQSGKYHYRGAKKVLKGVCNALSVLHKRNLVHRDVKPDNVMIDKNGRVILIDFNASRKISTAKKDTVVMGTVGYASPEQLGVSQSDSRTDIYALGILFNVMLTGKHPSEKLPYLRARKIIKKCTNVNPNDRYRTVKKLSESL